jgi:uncharacterized membrane protein YphA (DoxX/SURF4 family)
MKTIIHSLCFGTVLSANRAYEIVYTLFRIYCGWSIAYGAGFSKLFHKIDEKGPISFDNIAPGAPEWFVKQVADIGFTFISPSFWAYVAIYGEFIGGLLIALGILTRLSAIQMAFQFFVVSFLWYDAPMPFAMYYQQLIFWSFVMIAAKGDGYYSLGQWWNRRRTEATTVGLKVVLLLAVLGGFADNTFAQKGPLKGSGKVVEKTFALQNFDKVDVQDLDGEVKIEVGKPFSINVVIDDNLAPLLRVELTDEEKSTNTGKLRVYLAGNRDNKLYIEDTKIKVRITLPDLTGVEHSGNDALSVTGIVGRYLKAKAGGNGAVRLKGSIDELDMVRSGNAHVYAEELVAKTAFVKSMGNGNAVINVSESFVGTALGNSSIFNRGKGTKAIESRTMGNGRIQ